MLICSENSVTAFKNIMEEITTQECNMSRTENHNASKKRKMDERVVVTVKMQENDKKLQKSEGPPSDCWSWRKYGQKPIKGSPYPRGYYRCSTSKGCSAKKQVERCKTNSSMLIITYTSTHNHPGPALSPIGSKAEEEKLENSAPSTPKQDHEQQAPTANVSEDQFHYSQSPFNSSQDDILINQEEGNPFSDNIDQTPGVVYNENVLQQPFSDDPVKVSPVSKSSEENDFYDELEELPTSSFFMALMRSSFYEERIPVNPA